MHDRSHTLVMVNYLNPRDVLIIIYTIHGNWQFLFKISLLQLSVIGYLNTYNNQYFASSSIDDYIEL